MNNHDEIDIALLKRVSEKPGMSIIELIRPFLLERSETVLRQRVRGLGLLKLISFQRTKHEIHCFPAEA